MPSQAERDEQLSVGPKQIQMAATPGFSCSLHRVLLLYACCLYEQGCTRMEDIPEKTRCQGSLMEKEQGTKTGLCQSQEREAASLLHRSYSMQLVVLTKK